MLNHNNNIFHFQDTEEITVEILDEPKTGQDIRYSLVIEKILRKY